MQFSPFVVLSRKHLSGQICILHDFVSVVPGTVCDIWNTGLINTGLINELSLVTPLYAVDNQILPV